MTEPRVVDFETYAAERGASRQDYGDAGMHSGAAHVSRRARSAAMMALAGRDAGLQARRDAIRAEYDAAVAAGRLRPNTAIERLRLVAAGHPDNESVQAARRLLAKHDRRISDSLSEGANHHATTP